MTGIGPKYEAAKREIVKILNELGPSPSKNIRAKMSKRSGNYVVSQRTFYVVLSTETKSKNGEILLHREKNKRIYYLPSQASKLIKEKIEVHQVKGAEDQAQARAWRTHSNRIKRIIGLMIKQLPVVLLESIYPSGGLTFEGLDVSMDSIDTKCSIKGPYSLPVEKDPIFNHIFTHREIGERLRKDWDAYKKAIIVFEEQKGRLYCKLKNIIEDRMSLVSDKLVITRMFVDFLYDAIVSDDSMVEEVKKWHLVKENSFFRIDRGDGFLIDGWLYLSKPIRISNDIVDQINAEYQILINLFQQQEYVAEAQAIHDELNKLSEWKVELETKLRDLHQREIYSRCSLVMTNN